MSSKMIYYIYKITVGDFIYIGSTKDPKTRWSHHQSNMNINNPNRYDYKFKLYEKMRFVGVDKCEFIIIRTLDLNSKLEARIEEQKEIDVYGLSNLLNTKNAHLSRNQRLKTERDRAKLKRKQLILEDKESYLKWEREKRNLTRAKQKEKDPEAYLQKQRDYLANKKQK